MRKAKGEPLAALGEAAKLWRWAVGNGDFMWDFMGFHWILHWILEDFTGFSWDIRTNSRGLPKSRNHEVDAHNLANVWVGGI